MSYLLILTTVPSRKEARYLADVLLTHRLAACVNISAPVESVYWWNGKKEVSKEYVLLIKTKASVFDRLKRIILEKHSYDNPEVIALPIQKGSEAYLTWLKSEVRSNSVKRTFSLPANRKKRSLSRLP